MPKKLLQTIILFLAVNVGSAQIKKETQAIDFTHFLLEMSNPASLAKWPEIEWKNLQSSALKTDNRHYPGYFANKEIGNFVRIEEKGNGRREWVLMEHNGPGAIVRMWSPNMAKDAILRIYFDGNKKPSIEVNMMKLFYGEDFIKPPFAALKARGGNVYLPIPYAEGCRITVDKNFCGWAPPPDLFYVIQYRAYTQGTNIETFDMEQYEKNGKLLSEVTQALEHPDVEQNDTDSFMEKSVNPGQTVELNLKPGNLAINYVSIKIEAGNLTAALRSTMLRLSFDSLETVNCPIGDFFGSGDGLNPYHDWIRTVEEDGRMSCRWIMPYEKSAKLKIECTGKQAIKFNLSINYQPWNWDDRSMYFHANWGFDRGINNLPLPNFNFIFIKGKGVYVGETLSVTNFSPRWWGEGMEKVTVDDESFPSQFGTGSEDYYGYAWGDRKIFDAPFHAQPKIPEGPEFYGTTVNTRTRSLDAIPFKSSLNLDMEVLTQGYFKKEFTELDYGVATYWYGFKESQGKWEYKPQRMNNQN